MPVSYYTGFPDESTKERWENVKALVNKWLVERVFLLVTGHGYIRQQTTRCFRTRDVSLVPARPNVRENSGDFCTSASTGSSPWRVRAGLRMDSPWTSPQAATVCTEQGQPQRAGNPL